MIRLIRAIALSAALGLPTYAGDASAHVDEGARSGPLPLRDAAGVVAGLPVIDPARTMPMLEVAEASFEDRVAEVQRMLMRQGFDPGPIDGRLGVRTRDAIRAYQSLVRAKELEGAGEGLAGAKGPPLPVLKPAAGG